MSDQPSQITTPAVTLIDSPERIVRRPQDALHACLSLAGIGLVLLLAIYAHGTTSGVTEDVSSAVAKTARQVLLVPVNVLEGAVAYLAPLAVIIATLARRHWRTTALILAAGSVAAIITQMAIYLLTHAVNNPLTTALSAPGTFGPRLTLSTYIATLAAVLTTAGAAGRSRTVRTSWYALSAVLFLAVIQGKQSLPAVLIALLVGRTVALTVCYFAGLRSNRAWGASLVQGLHRAGLAPRLVVRLDPVDDLEAWQVTAPNESGLGGVVPDPLTDPHSFHIPRAWPGIRPHTQRTFAVWDEDDQRMDVIVLDSERHVLGVLSSMLDTIRNRGLEQRWIPTVKETAERMILMNHSARAAGVRTRTTGTASQADSSIIIPFEPLPPTESSSPDKPLTKAAITNLWEQLCAAHTAGLAHHNISERAIAVGEDGHPWLLNWDDGEIAASDLSHRIDNAQMLTLTALHVGAERAIDIARDVIGQEALDAVAPLLQKAALPAATRAGLRKQRDLLADLREALMAESDIADTAPMRLERISVRTVLLVVIGVVAAIIVFGSLRISDITEAVHNANPWWMLVSFACGLITYLGAAIGLVAFTPEKIGLWRTTLVQVAASIVTLVAPAGIGPAAMDLRYLTKARVPTALAGATVALTQVSRFVITVLLLVIVALGSGSAGSITLPQLPTVITVLSVITVAAVAFVIPPVRTWVWQKAGPTLTQIWPRVVWAIGNPKRLGLAILGNIIMTIGYVAAFGFALLAFGYTLSPISLAITFLVSNSAGSVVPSPGGVGPVEVALTSGLALAGIPYATALSTTVIYRLLTFWGRVPLGWVALRYLEKTRAI